MAKLLGQGVNTLKKMKNDCEKVVTKQYQLLQVSQSFGGYDKSYTPLDEDGRQLPSEGQTIKQDPRDLVARVEKEWTALFDMMAGCDKTNCTAAADIVVRDEAGDPFVIAERVPVTTLMPLQKKADDILTLIRHIPTLSMSRTWTWDDNANCYVSDEEFTDKTEKVHRHQIVVEPTEFHPAQTHTYTEDRPIGTWRTVWTTSCRPAAEVAAMEARAIAFKYAIGEAVQKANTAEMQERKIAKPIFDWILRGVKPAAQQPSEA